MASFLIEAFAAIILLLPAFLILNRVHFHNGKRTALYFLFALYLAAVYNIVGLPTVQFLVFDATLSLVPFHPMAEDIRGTVLNVLLFVPLGFFLPLMWNKYRSLKSAALFGLGMTVAIELAQLLTWRVTDVNDILTNFAGTLVGCGAFLPFKQCTVGSKRTKDIPVIFLTVGIVMFLGQPLIASFLYRIT